MITIIIQARMGSERLPGKVMMEIGGKPMLYYVINQVKHCKDVEKIIVATTTLKEDDIIFDYVKSLKIETFRGSPLDVLDRYYQCAKKNKAKKIIRITADDPLVDPHVISKCIKKFESADYDYVSNTIKKNGNDWVFDSNGFPIGIAMEVFSFEALERAWNMTKKPSDREHVTPFMKNTPNLFKLSNIESEEDYSNFRVTVDHKEDFTVVKKLIENFPLNEVFNINKITTFFKQNNDLAKINSKFTFMEGYLKSIKDE